MFDSFVVYLGFVVTALHWAFLFMATLYGLSTLSSVFIRKTDTIVTEYSASAQFGRMVKYLALFVLIPDGCTLITMLGYSPTYYFQ